ncbi:MAG: hydroxymethylbilane synthase, partial [Rudaea sp.]
EPPYWLPAAGQGAIAVELRAGDARTLDLLAPLHDEATARCVAAERALTRHLQGSCQVPIAAFCIETEIGLHLSGLVGDAASGKLVRTEDDGQSEAPEALGERVAQRLLELGAGKLLGK